MQILEGTSALSQDLHARFQMLQRRTFDALTGVADTIDELGTCSSGCATLGGFPVVGARVKHELAHSECRDESVPRIRAPNSTLREIADGNYRSNCKDGLGTGARGQLGRVDHSNAWCPSLGGHVNESGVSGLDVVAELDCTLCMPGQHITHLQGFSDSLSSFVDDLESFVAELEAHLLRVRDIMSARLAVPPSASSAVQEHGRGVEGEGPGRGEEPFAGRGPELGSGGEQAAEEELQKLSRARAAAEISARLSHLRDLAARARRSSGPLARARRLGAQLARLGERGSGAELEALRAEVEAALREAELEGPGLGDAGAAAGAEGARPAAGLGPAATSGVRLCEASGVAAAAAHFDEVLKGFKGQILRMMLPPEVENLHRVVHSLEVLRNSLLWELGGSGGGLPAEAAAVSLAADCERYFAGVAQLEADLAHYSELAKQEQSQHKPLQQQSTAQRGGQARVQLQPLELPPARRHMLQQPQAELGRRGSPALNAGAFR